VIFPNALNLVQNPKVFPPVAIEARIDFELMFIIVDKLQCIKNKWWRFRLGCWHSFGQCLLENSPIQMNVIDFCQLMDLDGDCPGLCRCWEGLLFCLGLLR
jgi:hypothetical protein